MTPPAQRPLVLVISAPSGGGKTTLCQRLLADHPEIAYSVSCTTRAPREGEVDGKSYHFLAEPEFLRRVEAGDFLEYACVHGNWYGTPRDGVERQLAAGRGVLLDVDVQGAASIRGHISRLDPAHPMRTGFTDIFIAPPSLEVLERRLSGRATDAPEVIRRRMAQALSEMNQAGAYRHRIVNDDLDQAYREIEAIVRAEQQGKS